MSQADANAAGGGHKAGQGPLRSRQAWSDLCHVIAIYVAASVAMFTLTWTFSVEAETPSEKAYIYFAPNVVIASIAAFAALARVDLGSWVSGCLHWVSDRCFLVFFVHVWVLGQVRYSAAASIMEEAVPGIINILIVASATFLFSLAIAAAIRSVPGARRVAG